MCKMKTREDRAGTREDRAGWFLGRIMYENDLTRNVTAINVQFFTFSLQIIFLKKACIPTVEAQKKTAHWLGAKHSSTWLLASFLKLVFRASISSHGIIKRSYHSTPSMLWEPVG